MAGSHISAFASPYADRGAGVFPFTGTRIIFRDTLLPKRHRDMKATPNFRNYRDFLRALPREVEGPTLSKLVLPRSRLGGGAQ
jgi:hypothetical protein